MSALTTSTPVDTATADPSAAERTPLRERAPLKDRAGARLLAGALLPLVILAAWQLVTATGLVPAYRLPGRMLIVGPASAMPAGAEKVDHHPVADTRLVEFADAIGVHHYQNGFRDGQAAGPAPRSVEELINSSEED